MSVNINTTVLDSDVLTINMTLKIIEHDVIKVYILNVISANTLPYSVQLNESHNDIVFTAPQGAPPCEVYNFSVSATYVGATYTGDGCSVPSPVLSRMLPSLPDIENLESSLSHSLEKISETVTLQTTFLVLTITVELGFI